MLAVAGRWPNSEWTDDALFAAGEMYYLRAKAGKAKADDLLAEARRHLHRVARTADSPHRVSASFALAMIYAEGGWVASARRECEGLRRLPAATPVAFAGPRGKLGDLLRTGEAFAPSAR